MKLTDRLKHAWNAFNGESLNPVNMPYSLSSSRRPDRVVLARGNEKTIISSIYTRIAMDVAAISFEHARVDEDGRFTDIVDSGFNNCLTLSANVDQTGRAFIQDLVISMLDEGVVAAVPVDTSLDPLKTNSFDIQTIRVGKITEWFPEAVRVRLYNDRTGRKEEIILPKKMIAIIENPFYSVMNEPNSTMQRLIHKLSMLDAVDEQSSAGKLDLIVQLPYVIKSEARRQQADVRRKEIEDQLAGSKYGIAYTDGTEKITQLNRSLENNLLQQIEYLTRTLYSQLGMPETVFNGTADEATMLNYHNRTIEPIVSAISLEFRRKFLTKTARTQGQSVITFSDPFRLVPISQIADIADKFTRNEILSSNEVRQIIGYKPSKDPAADELRNKNLNKTEGQDAPQLGEEDGQPVDRLTEQWEEELQNGKF